MKNALIFGYNDYAFEIAKNISSTYENVCIFKLHDDKSSLAKEQEKYKIYGFDLSDDWDEIVNDFDVSESIVFCTLEDIAKNVFLTISLRDTFKDLIIISIAQGKESASKLELAGASRVIPTTETTAKIIVDMLEKPVVTKVLHSILYEQNDLQIAQIKVNKNNIFDDKYPADINWSRECKIILLSVVYEDMSQEFIYSNKAKHHPIQSGDIFVVVGYDKDIINFEQLLGSRV